MNLLEALPLPAALVLAALVGIGIGLLIGSRGRRRAKGELAGAATAGALSRVALLEAAIDSCGDAIFAKDRAGRYLLFNRAAERVTGQTREQMIGLDDRALFPAHQAEMLMALGRRVMSEGCTLTEEECLATVDGERHFLATKRPLRDAQGAVVGLIGISRDVTESRRSETALQAERELLAEMSAIAHLGGWSFDPLTGEGTWTAEVARIHDLDPGVAPDVAMGLDFFRGDSRQRIEAAIDAACSEGRSFDLELELVSATGRIKWVRSVGLAELGNGQVRRVRGFMQDISEQKHLTQELERHRHKLEDLVRERTDQLNEACVRAEAASRAKGLFLANMSHEIRTPLHAIAGLATLLRRSPLDALQLERLGTLDNAAQHLLALVSDVLDLSKIEAGRMTIDGADFELGALLLQVRDGVLAEAAAKGLELQVESDVAPLWLRGDALRLRQALLNYASNAVKFTQHGSVRLKARCKPADCGRVALHIEVVDTGIGIAAEHLPRLFERFEQGDMSTTRRFGGSGLGLALTRQLMALMGGSCGVDSSLGEGSRFWLELALPRAAALVPDGAAALDADLEAAVREQHAGRRVLLVEDNPVNREVATGLLVAVGIEVMTAADGIEAVERLRDSSPAMILMDLQMPRMDGLAAASTIRSMATGQALPILAMTANVTRETHEARIAAGMDGFVGKPFTAATLYQALLRWLPPRAAASPLPPAMPLPATPPPATPLPDKPLPATPLLRLFQRTHVADVERIRAAFAVSDWKALSQLAHAVRGSAGSVGLTAIQDAGAALEEALRQPEGSKHVARLCSALQAALQEALARADDGAAPAARPAVAAGGPARRPPDEWAAVRERLEFLLADGDIESAACIHQHIDALRSRLGERCAVLVDHVASFRYDDALALLRDTALP